ncbi:EboA family metabolite traffic protein [Fortiea sp. LEGE XX443]|uniref:EboA family metabolite traffic protein n=1 Tax=Fortiea sp. LEGE XX443 TaxID=1828611 RepID=UPI001881A31F|nr:EboA family metabolite traffic protein [Fortiea sp. LEGE XX443]MBE9006105.1 EboA family metabolite traffic protein [Fortiea sp. LEGE XX443]
MSAVIDCKITNISELLHHWVARQVTQDAVIWLNETREQINSGANARVFFSTFSRVPRHTGKNQLELTTQDLKAASEMRLGWCFKHWSVDQAARTLLVLTLAQANSEKYLSALEKVFTAADVGELVALYQALPLLPYPKKFLKLATQGVRSNMTAVFNAVALLNPYPAEYFDTLAWNQMVLKALFVGSPLHLIQGLDLRANPELARMLIDYAHERRSANRVISAEIWPLVEQFADAAILDDLQRAIALPQPT